MKLKYYLRGLGIGILVTAAITGISDKNARAEIIKEYEQRLQLEREDVYSTEELTSEIITEELTKEEQSYVTEDNRDKEKESEITMVIESALEQESLNDRIVEILIEVEPGDAAGNVAWQLHNAGVIDNKEEFIVFLQQNGYDKIIRTGLKKINMNDDWDTIGKKLTIKDYDVLDEESDILENQ